MVEEFKAILELLGDVTQIGGWVVGGWLVFKLIILLSTTGAIVYLTSKGIQALRQCISEAIASSEKKAITPPPPIPREEIEIKGLCITCDGTYEHVIDSLKMVRGHVNTASGAYIHAEGADWLRRAIMDKIDKDDGGEK